MPPPRAAYRRHLFPRLAAGESVPPLLAALDGAPLAPLDDALYQLVFRACRQYILPWYAPISQDREALEALVQAIRPLLREAQVRIGALPVILVPEDERPAWNARRARVTRTLCERVPRILVQHMRQYHAASDTPEGLAHAYELLGAHPGIVQGRVSDRYLRTSLAQCLASLRATAYADDPTSFSELDELLVLDLLVCASRASLAALSPGALCMMAHRALDRARTPSQGAIVQLAWLTRELVSGLVRVVGRQVRRLAGTRPTEKGAPPVDGPVPALTLVGLEALAESLQLSSRPFGAWMWAVVLTLGRYFAPVLDPPLVKLIMAHVYTDQWADTAAQALSTPPSAPEPDARKPTLDPESAFFRLSWLRFIYGGTYDAQRNTIEQALAPFFAPAAQVPVLHCALLLYESAWLCLLP
ncbi:hypothetical protein MNAN1_002403 [Malassezia nana]|uniref:PXA domain-containing protein n=1 Tax=Malassezia nana TaxID=180528 RepID=A0AAF0ESC2_9BASI|nr:hypothetical protein MNAN1_002403 [Malassezia nana]